MKESDELVREIVRSGTDFLEWLDRTFPDDPAMGPQSLNDVPQEEVDEGAGKMEAFEDAVHAWAKYVKGVHATHALELLFMGPHRN